MQMQKFILIIFITALSFNGFSQNRKEQRQQEKRERIEEMMQQEEEGVIIYNSSFVFGAKLVTDGYGVFFELGKSKSVNKATLFQLEISERKHIKEEKMGSIYSNSAPLIYGKENFFYPVKLGIQKQILLGNKANKNGVSVTGNYGGGLSVGLLRPYYVQIPDGNQVGYIKYNGPDSLDFLYGQVLGGPSLSKGWNEITVSPGAYAKLGLRFDYGIYNEVVSAIEVGFTAEYYAKKIPQMVYNEQKQFFYGAYFAILFGKRK